MTTSLRTVCAQAMFAGLLCASTTAFAEPVEEDATLAQATTTAAEAEEPVQETRIGHIDPGPAIPAYVPPSVGQSTASNSSNSFHADMDLKFRVQPLGLVLSTRLYNEHEYMKNNIGMLFSHVFFRAGAAVNISPAYAEVGPEVEFQPIRVFNVRAAYLGTYNFGTFKYMLSYDDPNPITRDDELDAIKDQAENGFSQRLEIQPTFQAALGKIAVRNTFTFQRMWYSDDEFTGPYLRESSYDRMITNNGDTVLANLLVAMYQVADPDGPRGDGTAYLGAFHEWARGVALNDNRHRLGLMGLYVPKHNWGKFYKPRLVLQAGYNLVDRDNGRDGRFFIQGQLGFSLHGR